MRWVTPWKKLWAMLHIWRAKQMAGIKWFSNRFSSTLFFRDALITCVVNTCTCLTAGVLVFSILGNMAYIQNSTVEQVAQDGPGLVFLTYPELVLTLPASFIWAILFFAMLLVSDEHVYFSAFLLHFVVMGFENSRVFWLRFFLQNLSFEWFFLLDSEVFPQ